MADDMTDKMNETLEFNRSKVSPGEPELKTAGSFNGYRIIYDPALTQGWIEIRDSMGRTIARIDGVEAIHLSGSRVSRSDVVSRQKYSLLESQFANCHKEIRRLREELLRYSTEV